MSSSNLEKREVRPLELFFDLVFAFAISQLSRHLEHDLTWFGAGETLVLFVAVFTVWLHTSWTVTMLPEHTNVTRMSLVTMLLGLWMNASLGSAFGDAPWPFAITLLVIQLGRTIWTIGAVKEPIFREHFVRVLVWLVAATPLWVMGAQSAPASRIVWWGAAAGLELVGDWFAHPVPGRRIQSENLAFDAAHMLERCGLFVLIALGETIITTGSAIAERLSLSSILTSLLAFAGTASLWALAYGRAYDFALEHPERTQNPVRLSRYALNAVSVMVVGLIVVAVANELVVLRPNEHRSIGLALMLGGGPTLFIVAQACYIWSISGHWSKLRLVGAAVVFVAGLGSLIAPVRVALGAVAACLSVLALADARLRRIDSVADHPTN